MTNVLQFIATENTAQACPNIGDINRPLIASENMCYIKVVVVVDDGHILKDVSVGDRAAFWSTFELQTVSLKVQHGQNSLKLFFFSLLSAPGCTYGLFRHKTHLGLGQDRVLAHWFCHTPDISLKIYRGLTLTHVATLS